MVFKADVRSRLMRTMRKPPVGARPGTLAIPPGLPESRLLVVAYDETAMEEYDAPDLEDVRTLRASGRRVWVNVQGLGDEKLLRGLAELFGMHVLALEDVVNVPVRPKAEPYDDQLLIISHVPVMHGETDLTLRQVSVVLGPDYVLTFQEGTDDLLEPIRRRLEVPDSLMRKSPPDYLGYAILDVTIDGYYPVMEHLENHIDELEERVLVDASPETLRSLHIIKAQLAAVRHGIVPQREAVNRLVQEEDDFFSPEVRTYLRDTMDHVIQMTEAVERARELVNGLINTHLSVLSNRMNEVMKTLTIIASIFVPLTFIAGLYGMNFRHMPELDFPWAYPALLAVMVFVAGGMVVYFRRKGWLGGRRR